MRALLALRKTLFWMVQLGMMFDIPGLSRRAGLEGTRLFANALAHADRVLIIALFAGLIVLAWREAPRRSGDRKPRHRGTEALRKTYNT